MKIKSLYLFGIVALVVVLLLFKAVWNKFGGGSANAPKKNSPEIESLMNWTQSQLSVNVFTTREDAPGAKLEDKQMAHISYMSFFNFSSNNGAKVKKIEITAATLKQGKGKLLLIQPAHERLVNGSRSYIFTSSPNISAKDIGNGVKNVTISGVDSLDITNSYFDEVPNIGGNVQFGLITKNLGTVSEQSILNANKTYESSKVLNYLGITANDLDGEIVLDFTVTFVDGKKYIKRFSGTIEGSKILSSPFYLIEMNAL